MSAYTGKTPPEILNLIYERVAKQLDQAFLTNREKIEDVEYVCRNIKNKAGSRVLMACLLAKLHQPSVDIRKPYTEIGGKDTYSGRRYDESYIQRFINDHGLPCNSTTAWLTPAWRNRNAMLVPGMNMSGTPTRLYEIILQLLDDVYQEVIKPDDLFAEVLRWLLVVRDEQRARLASLISTLGTLKGSIPLSSEEIVKLIRQHMDLPKTSRLPVLVVAAAYNATGTRLGERILPLRGHNAADRQTGAIGDVEVILENEDKVVTCYEMKDKQVTIVDLEVALAKLQQKSVDNYIFITTDPIDETVANFASSLYEQTGGVEFAILDCLGFLRHFLHFFHRFRLDFLEEYQRLVLNEPESAVSQPVKEAFLVLRQAAETR